MTFKQFFSPPPSQKLTPYLFGKSAKYCLLTILFFLPLINSFAQTRFDSPDGKLTYELHFTYEYGGTVFVKAKNMNINEAITIPQKALYNNKYYTVDSIKNSGFYSSKITSITIPNTVKSIGDRAFWRCKSLTSVTISGTSVTYIGSQAFKDCTNLTSINIPSSVTHIGAEAFSSCSSLTSISIPSSVTHIGAEAFSSCSSLTSISIPSSVTSIREDTFKDCANLRSINIPSSVTSIGNRAFTNCSSLTDITIPNTVTSIGDNAFMNCSGLTSITIPNSVTSIGGDAFRNCNYLTSIVLESETPPTLGNDVFTFISSSATFYVPNERYLTADKWKDMLKRYKVVIPNKQVLSTGKWNFVAGLDNQASLYNNNNPTSFVSGFSADNTINNPTNAQNPHCDIAIVGYDYTNNAWSSNYLYADNTMEKGAGYFVWPFNENAKNTTITSDATMTTVDMSSSYLTSGSVTWSATNNGNATGGAKWFAFGNPFDKQLTKSEILSVLSNVQSDALYTYNAYSRNWNDKANVVYPGQGFMVASANNQNTVSGTISYPSTTSNLPAQPENYGIRFSVNANDLISNIYAKQENNCQDGFDTKDAYALFGNNENLVEPYFVVEGRQIIHNRYNSDNYACEINFHAQKNGVAQLSVSDVPEGTTVSIVDLTMNEETVLESEPYQIDIEAGENAGRYQIKINKSSVSLPQTIANETNISIWNNNREIFVKGEKLQRVEVYNTLGQKVYQREISGDAYNFTFDNEGAYIVKVTSENGTKSHKIQVLPAL